jgi:carboxylesterase
VLPGHNETPRSLAKATHEDWLEAARQHLHGLRSQYVCVFVVGLSLGGLLSLALAAEEPVDGVAVVGTPLRLRSPLAWLIPVLKHLMPFPRKRFGSDIRDEAARRRHPSYDVMPLAAVHEMQRLQRRVRRGLRRVRAPLLVAHGAHDRTADPADSKRILEGVGSAERKHLILEASAHIVPVDHDAPLLARETVRFLARFA